jgi:hypothetical protein
MSTLQLQLLDQDTGWIAHVALPHAVEDLLDKQFELCVEGGNAEDFLRWFAQALATGLPEAVSYELRPPSSAQVSFATAIARGLNIPLPPEVLRYRGPMHDFLERYANSFRQRTE